MHFRESYHLCNNNFFLLSISTIRRYADTALLTPPPWSTKTYPTQQDETLVKRAGALLCEVLDSLTLKETGQLFIH